MIFEINGYRNRLHQNMDQQLNKIVARSKVGSTDEMGINKSTEYKDQKLISKL